MLRTEMPGVVERQQERERCWLIVASRDHVLMGQQGGFCQAGHGKLWPLQKMTPGDWVAFYSGKEALEGGQPWRRFTGLGRIAEGEPYQHELGPLFKPYRRRMHFHEHRSEVEIEALLEQLSFIPDKQRWGLPLRPGFLEIPRADMALIAGAMGLEEDAAVLCGAFAY